MRLLLASFAVALAGSLGCAPTASPAGAARAAQPSRPPLRSCGAAIDPPATVRDVDWCNRQYDEQVALVGGVHELHDYVCDAVPGHAGEHTTTYWALFALDYADVDHDGTEDVTLRIDAIHHACDPAADTRTVRTEVYTVRDGQVLALDW